MDEFKNNENTDMENGPEIDETVAAELEETAEAEVEITTEEDAASEEITLAPKTNMKKELIDWAVSIVVALAIALFIRQFIFTLVRVDGPSMQPTLHHNDTLYVNRFMYTPEVGDVIIFRPRNNPDTPYVKRIIALEGQEVNIDAREGAVYVDGKELVEDYISEELISAGTMKYPYVVPEGHVFVLGDNRNNSRDSRDASVGAVSRDSIIGEVLFRLLPVSDFGGID